VRYKEHCEKSISKTEMVVPSQFAQSGSLGSDFARAETAHLTASPFPSCLSLAEFSAAVAMSRDEAKKARAFTLTI
jgi:hypothetical protein